ncbi:DJ-1/PfpI family protein [Saccharibacillus alkalitolerans]|uniref:Glutamine amidotransferase n=1 Tax=Saccharibacillus alkalitolerans TaxID=2705290 RepID=A0ABX0F6K0_9BACL|nr:DJ-1/PfpI family protein [Saccharibacillus alkalitolerans]NGZ75228.1 glutamine amidotransferase [Saccharibacillus alkalitolerans]
MKYAYTYVLDTMADWELGMVTAQLNSGQYFKHRGSRLPVKTVGASKRPITTMGGMTIQPDLTVEEVTHETSAILLLPGANTWEDPEHLPIIEKTEKLLNAGGRAAAICGATAALANHGILDNRPHTSNGLEYLNLFCPAYRGSAYYRDEKIVTDGNLITTGASGGLLLAREVIALLELFSPETLEAWYNYFNTGDPSYFYALMETIM